MNEECKNCRFSKDVDCGYLLCRRYPPSVGVNHDNYPEVSRGKWCGEWKAIAVYSNFELTGKPHQEGCPFHIREQGACYCGIEGDNQDRTGLPCYACYHGFMTEEEVRSMDD